MLVYVPQSYVALVYVGDELRGVLEAGLSGVAPVEGLVVHYVDLLAAGAPQEAEALAVVH